MFSKIIRLSFLGLIIFLNSYSQEMSYKSAKIISEEFYTEIKDLNIILEKDVQINRKKVRVTIYKEKEVENEMGIDLYVGKGILRIDNYYYSLELNRDYSFKTEAVFGNDQNEEIILYTGCLSDGGCPSNTFFIRLFESSPFTVTDLGFLDIFSSLNNIPFSCINYSKSAIKKELESSKKPGECILCGWQYKEKCYFVFQSFKLSEKGIKKSTFIKKLPAKSCGCPG